MYVLEITSNLKPNFSEQESPHVCHTFIKGPNDPQTKVQICPFIHPYCYYDVIFLSIHIANDVIQGVLFHWSHP